MITTPLTKSIPTGDPRATLSSTAHPSHNPAAKRTTCVLSPGTLQTRELISMTKNPGIFFRQNNTESFTQLLPSLASSNIIVPPVSQELSTRLQVQNPTPAPKPLSWGATQQLLQRLLVPSCLPSTPRIQSPTVTPGPVSVQSLQTQTSANDPLTIQPGQSVSAKVYTRPTYVMRLKNISSVPTNIVGDNVQYENMSTGKPTPGPPEVTQPSNLVHYTTAASSLLCARGSNLTTTVHHVTCPPPNIQSTHFRLPVSMTLTHEKLEQANQQKPVPAKNMNGPCHIPDGKGNMTGSCYIPDSNGNMIGPCYIPDGKGNMTGSCYIPDSNGNMIGPCYIPDGQGNLIPLSLQVSASCDNDRVAMTITKQGSNDKDSQLQQMQIQFVSLLKRLNSYNQKDSKKYQKVQNQKSAPISKQQQQRFAQTLEENNSGNWDIITDEKSPITNLGRKTNSASYHITNPINRSEMSPKSSAVPSLNSESLIFTESPQTTDHLPTIGAEKVCTCPKQKRRKKHRHKHHGHHHDQSMVAYTNDVDIKEPPTKEERPQKEKSDGSQLELHQKRISLKETAKHIQDKEHMKRSIPPKGVTKVLTNQAAETATHQRLIQSESECAFAATRLSASDERPPESKPNTEVFKGSLSSGARSNLTPKDNVLYRVNGLQGNLVHHEGLQSSPNDRQEFKSRPSFISSARHHEPTVTAALTGQVEVKGKNLSYDSDSVRLSGSRSPASLVQAAKSMMEAPLIISEPREYMHKEVSNTQPISTGLDLKSDDETRVDQRENHQTVPLPGMELVGRTIDLKEFNSIQFNDVPCQDAYNGDLTSLMQQSSFDEDSGRNVFRPGDEAIKIGSDKKHCDVNQESLHLQNLKRRLSQFESCLSAHQQERLQRITTSIDSIILEQTTSKRLLQYLDAVSCSLLHALDTMKALSNCVRMTDTCDVALGDACHANSSLCRQLEGISNTVTTLSLLLERLLLPDDNRQLRDDASAELDKPIKLEEGTILKRQSREVSPTNFNSEAENHYTEFLDQCLCKPEQKMDLEEVYASPETDKDSRVLKSPSIVTTSSQTSEVSKTPAFASELKISDVSTIPSTSCHDRTENTMQCNFNQSNEADSSPELPAVPFLIRRRLDPSREISEVIRTKDPAPCLMQAQQLYESETTDVYLPPNMESGDSGSRRLDGLVKNLQKVVGYSTQGQQKSNTVGVNISYTDPKQSHWTSLKSKQTHDKGGLQSAATHPATNPAETLREVNVETSSSTSYAMKAITESCPSSDGVLLKSPARPIPYMGKVVPHGTQQTLGGRSPAAKRRLSDSSRVEPAHKERCTERGKNSSDACSDSPGNRTRSLKYSSLKPNSSQGSPTGHLPSGTWKKKSKSRSSSKETLLDKSLHGNNRNSSENKDNQKKNVAQHQILKEEISCSSRCHSNTSELKSQKSCQRDTTLFPSSLSCHSVCSQIKLNETCVSRRTSEECTSLKSQNSCRTDTASCLNLLTEHSCSKSTAHGSGSKERVREPQSSRRSSKECISPTPIAYEHVTVNRSSKASCRDPKYNYFKFNMTSQEHSKDSPSSATSSQHIKDRSLTATSRQNIKDPSSTTTSRQHSKNGSSSATTRQHSQDHSSSATTRQHSQDHSSSATTRQHSQDHSSSATRQHSQDHSSSATTRQHSQDHSSSATRQHSKDGSSSTTTRQHSKDGSSSATTRQHSKDGSSSATTRQHSQDHSSSATRQHSKDGSSSATTRQHSQDHSSSATTRQHSQDHSSSATTRQHSQDHSSSATTRQHSQDHSSSATRQHSKDGSSSTTTRQHSQDHSSSATRQHSQDGSSSATTRQHSQNSSSSTSRQYSKDLSSSSTSRKKSRDGSPNATSREKANVLFFMAPSQQNSKDSSSTFRWTDNTREGPVSKDKVKEADESRKNLEPPLSTSHHQISNPPGHRVGSGNHNKCGKSSCHHVTVSKYKSKDALTQRGHPEHAHGYDLNHGNMSKTDNVKKGKKHQSYTNDSKQTDALSSSHICTIPNTPGQLSTSEKPVGDLPVDYPKGPCDHETTLEHCSVIKHCSIPLERIQSTCDQSLTRSKKVQNDRKKSSEKDTPSQHLAVKVHGDRSTRRRGSPGEVIGPMNKRGLQYRQECFHIIDSVYNFKHSTSFRSEVNPQEVPDYYQLVKYPMCLDMVASRLRNRLYDRLEDFVADMRRIFWNCRLYNKTGCKILKSCGVVEAFLNRKLAETFPNMDFSGVSGKPPFQDKPRSSVSLRPVSTDASQPQIDPKPAKMPALLRELFN